MAIVPKFSIGEILLSVLGYKGLPYPGGWLLPHNRAKGNTLSRYGTPLRKQDADNRWYFMPVTLVYKQKEYEIPNAVISFTGKKTIVETPMIGRKGSVKEQISINDYEINLQGVALSDDFPEEELARLNELYTVNESVSLQCALTDIFMEEDDKVIVKSLDISGMQGTESFVVIRMGLVTDKSFELKIE